MCREVIYVQGTIVFEEMEDSEEQWHQSLTHTCILRFELLPLYFGSAKKYLFRRMLSDEPRHLGRHMKAMPYAAQVV